MTDPTIFARNAPSYWAAGLSVMPLQVRSKRPILDGWEIWSKELPSQEQQAQWLHAYANSPVNMGLVLGKASGVVALDIDTEDGRVWKAVNEVVAHLESPWTRTGKKGNVRLYGYVEGVRTFRIANEMGERIVELLADGAQVVLPPSIHPDTGLAYRADCNLVDVIDTIRDTCKIPIDVEARFRAALEKHGVRLRQKGVFRATAVVPQGARETEITAHAGILARDVQRGTRTLNEAFSEMGHWIREYVTQTKGDEIPEEVGHEKLLRFLYRDISEGGRRLPLTWADGLEAADRERIERYLKKNLEGETFEQRDSVTILEDARSRSAALDRADIRGRNAVLDDIMSELAGNTSLGEMHKAGLVRKLAEWNKDMGMTVGIIQKEIKRRQASLDGLSNEGGFEGASHTEIARALKKDLENQYGEIRQHSGQFWRWGGACWVHISDDELYRRIADNYGAVCPAAKRFSDHKGIIDVYRKEAGAELRTSRIKGTNFANGYLDVEGNLHSHSKEFGCVTVLPYEFSPAAAGNFPKFRQFLADCWGHEPDYEARVQALREAIALTLVAETWRFELCFCLYGAAQSGKSTMMNIIKGLVNIEDVSSCPPTEWADKYRPFSMFGKLVNLCGELSESRTIEGSKFKEIISGESITIEDKFKSPFSTEIVASHWFCSNHLPKTADSSQGFWRRWLFLSFSRMRKSSEIVIRYENEILEDEREAIAAWAIETLPEVLKRESVSKPPSHFVCVNEARKRNDSVLWFVEDYCITDAAGSVKMMDMFARYRSVVLTKGGGKPVALLTFQNRLREHGVSFDSETVFGLRSKLS